LGRSFESFLKLNASFLGLAGFQEEIGIEFVSGFEGSGRAEFKGEGVFLGGEAGEHLQGVGGFAVGKENGGIQLTDHELFESLISGDLRFCHGHGAMGGCVARTEKLARFFGRGAGFFDLAVSEGDKTFYVKNGNVSERIATGGVDIGRSLVPLASFDRVDGAHVFEFGGTVDATKDLARFVDASFLEIGIFEPKE